MSKGHGCPCLVPEDGMVIKVLALSDNYRSIKADLYNIEEINEGPCRSKRLAFSLPSDLGYENETVNLTFDLATWFLFATHRLVMMIIRA